MDIKHLFPRRATPYQGEYEVQTFVEKYDNKGSNFDILTNRYQT